MREEGGSLLRLYKQDAVDRPGITYKQTYQIIPYHIMSCPDAVFRLWDGGPHSDGSAICFVPVSVFFGIGIGIGIVNCASVSLFGFGTSR